MNKMLVAVFENETTAHEGLKALKDLHKTGDITLFATAVITKDEKGDLQLKIGTDRGEVGAATGLLAGSLIGLIGGPLGIALSATMGTFSGVMFDADSNEINGVFVHDVSKALRKGKTAVIAEIDETLTVPVDLRLKDTNATVFRRRKYEVAEEHLERESKAIAAEYQNLKEEFREAGEGIKAEIGAAIAKLEEKAAITNEQLTTKLIEAKNEFLDKANAMQEQIKYVKEKKKAKLQKRIEELKNDYWARTEKLKQAGKLLSEALGRSEVVKQRENDLSVLL
jgi:uncharacterized membrane protein